MPVLGEGEQKARRRGHGWLVAQLCIFGSLAAALVAWPYADLRVDLGDRRWVWAYCLPPSGKDAISWRPIASQGFSYSRWRMRDDDFNYEMEAWSFRMGPLTYLAGHNR
jgi:hypothetical protein